MFNHYLTQNFTGGVADRELAENHRDVTDVLIDNESIIYAQEYNPYHDRPMFLIAITTISRVVTKEYSANGVKTITFKRNRIVPLPDDYVLLLSRALRTFFHAFRVDGHEIAEFDIAGALRLLDNCEAYLKRGLSGPFVDAMRQETIKQAQITEAMTKKMNAFDSILCAIIIEKAKLSSEVAAWADMLSHHRGPNGGDHC